MLYLLELFDEHLVRLLGVEPELGSVGDGGDDYGLVKEAEVGGGDACDSVAEDARQWRVCVCVFLLYSVQLGGQRSLLSTTALMVYLAHS